MKAEKTPSRSLLLRLVAIALLVCTITLAGCDGVESIIRWLPNGTAVDDTSSFPARRPLPRPFADNSSSDVEVGGEGDDTSSQIAADRVLGGNFVEKIPSNRAGDLGTPSASEALSEQDERLRILQQGHSHYGYYTLTKELQRCYEEIENAIFRMLEEFTVEKVSADEFTRVLEYFIQDNPLVYWLDVTYSYRERMDGKTDVTFVYTSDYDSVGETLRKIDAVGSKMISRISDKLPDFDRMTMVHDEIIRMAEYDLEAPRQSDVAGALIDGRATCLGYARAYQYILSRMGMMALMVYGFAKEGHAWNMVWLEGSYYHVDATWDDRMPEHRAHISHAFMLLSDKAISATHSVDKVASYSMPSCKSEESYFARVGTLVDTDDEETLKAVISKALDKAAVENDSVLAEIGFVTSELGEKVSQSLESGRLDRIVREACEARSLPAPTGRYMNDTNTVLTYLR